MSTQSNASLAWCEQYIKLNQSSDLIGQQMRLSDTERRPDSVVMECSPFHLKVAFKGTHTVYINTLDAYEGKSTHQIDHAFFNMDAFTQAAQHTKDNT